MCIQGSGRWWRKCVCMRSDGKESKLSGFYSALTSWSWSWSLWAHVCVPLRVRECTCLCLRCSESMCLEREAWGGWNAQVGVSGPEVSPILLPLLLKYWGWICNKGHTNEDTVLLKVILKRVELECSSFIEQLHCTSHCSRSVVFNRCAARIFDTCNTWLCSQGHWPLLP